jgi:DNA-binding NtrC family response regulator
LVDDDPAVLEAFVDFFKDDYAVLEADTGPKAIDLAQLHTDIAVAVVDIKMAPMDGIATTRELRKILPAIRIIFYTAFPGEYNEGDIDRTEDPFDFVVKARSLNEINRAVRKAHDSWQLQTGSLWRRAEIDLGLIGSSRKMQAVYEDIYRLARTDAKVLILGESGTGKEMVAKALHRVSPRRHAPFAYVSILGESRDQICASLFGALAGTYTDLTYDRTGTMEYASEGVVLIDEVGDLPPEVQTLLLRVIDTGEYQLPTSPAIKKTNARILFATHRNIESLVAENRFRGDLYYRLGAITISLPPLREREEDIMPLADYFVNEHTVKEGRAVRILDKSAYDVLLQYDWPGNVRQLNKVIERVVLQARGELIMADDIAEALTRYSDRVPNGQGALASQLDAYERTLIVRALVATDGEVSTAAKLLGINRSSLHRKINRFKIELLGLRNPD